jgi:CRISPR-associated protein Cst2
VIRVTQDPAPRLLYCFDTEDDGKTVNGKALLVRVEQGDIDAKELILGGPFALSEAGQALKGKGAYVGEKSGVKAAATEAVRRINGKLGIEG